MLLACNPTPSRRSVFLLGFLLPTVYIIILPGLAAVSYANSSLASCEAPTISKYICTSSASGGMAVVSMPTLYYFLYLIKDRKSLNTIIHSLRHLFVFFWCAFLATSTTQYPVVHIIWVSLMTVSAILMTGLQAYESNNRYQRVLFAFGFLFALLFATSATIGSVVGFCSLGVFFRYLPIISEYCTLILLFSHTSICLLIENHS